MGGYGSTRWGWHYKKTTVEECQRLAISLFKNRLWPGECGAVNWYIGDRPTNAISYRMETGRGQMTAIQLTYRLDINGSETAHLDYPVSLAMTRLPWGSARYWFICPLMGCDRRVGVLYRPPGQHYFGCRHCYNLTYRSCQETHQFEGLYKHTAAMMQDTMPGATAEDMRYLMDDRRKRRPPSGGYYERLMSEALRDLLSYDPYRDYLSGPQLCEKSGLTPGQLETLGEARLLLPDHDDLYRPKLAGWARKLAYLLGDGWTIEEIRAWARGRWSTPDPRQWPPDRAAWLPAEG